MGMRITQNAVLVNKANEVCFVREFPIADSRKKNREFFRHSDGEVVAKADVKPMNVTDVSSLLAFITAFQLVPQKPRSGFDQYYNDFGPTNPESPKTLTDDGLVKNIAIFLNVLHERVVKGGAEGAEAKAALNLLTAYNEVAGDNITRQEQDSLLKLAAGMFTPDQIAAERARLSGIPTASVTVAEASEDAELAAEIADENLSDEAETADQEATAETAGM